MCAVCDRKVVSGAIEMFKPLDRITEPNTLMRLQMPPLRQPRSVIYHLQSQGRVFAPRGDAHKPTNGTWGDGMLDRVLHQRLEHEGRRHALQCRRFDTHF